MCPFIDLQTQLLPYWRTRTSFVTAGKGGIVYMIALDVFIEIVFVASGGCLTAWPLFQTLTFVTMMVLDLLNVAAANAKLDEMGDVYRATRGRIRELVWMASRADDVTGPSPRKAAALRDLAHLDDLLSEYADSTPYRGGFLGFKVTYGFIRNLAVTFFTICLGFWTVLRGLGIFVSIEQACPTIR
jgi:hypothetical protein